MSVTFTKESENLFVLLLKGIFTFEDLEEIQNNRQVLRNYKEVRYESLVADPRSVMQELLDFCDLKPHGGYEEQLPTSLPDMNRKWKENLSDLQLATLDHAIGGTLRELGYVE